MALKLEDLKIGQGAFHLGPIRQNFSETGLYIIRGKNGAGKTTLLRTLMGRIGKLGGGFSGLKSPIGAVGVEPLLFGTWSVHENIRWFHKILGRPCVYPKSISHFLPQQVSHLSQGMKRQVELSLVLELQLPTLFLDEPLSPLDRGQRELYATRIAQQAKDSLILVTTHFEEELFGKPAGILEL
jgi:ABC-2 type transport system ATP-binding protein